MDGKELQNLSLEAYTATLDVSNLSAGIYYVEIKSLNYTRFEKVIILR